MRMTEEMGEMMERVRKCGFSVEINANLDRERRSDASCRHASAVGEARPPLNVGRSENASGGDQTTAQHRSESVETANG